MTQQNIIDRRTSGKNKSIGNRERFMRRYKDKIAETVKKSINSRGIRDVINSGEVRIPKKDLNEPFFHHGPGGKRDMVHPGNQEYVQGDRMKRPQGGSGGSGKGSASDQGEGEDDFTFTLSKEEFMKVFFEDLALPNLERTQLAETPDYKTQRAGYSSDGNPSNMHIVRSLRGSIGRRIAMGTSSRSEIEELEAKLVIAEENNDKAEIESLTLQIKVLRDKIHKIPFLDPIDLRYRNSVRVPIPASKAVMFCLMDVSGSMDEDRKDLSKRFFILLYLFLTKHYEKIDIVFIRHHVHAEEVDEENFFHSRETGGTIVSSALVLMDEIIKKRYNPSEWNIYGAQASDGDNWGADSTTCRHVLVNKILPVCRYYAYIQVVEEEQTLWEEYEKLSQVCKHFAIRKAIEASQIYPVFHDLFKKESVKT